jgi:membrane fusion protein (multidrug efflux system)
MKIPPPFLLMLGLVCSSGLTTACRQSTAEAPKATAAALPVGVTLVRPHQGEIYRSVHLPANVAPYQQVTLYAKVPGYLKSIAVDKGDRVKEGDMLGEIELPEMLADLSKNKAELEAARIDYQRVSEAAKKAPDLVVPQTVDNAKAKWDVAKASLDRTETLLRYARIVAPFSGIVSKRMVDPGAFIPAATSGSSAQNAAILTLVDSSRVRVQTAIPEMEAPFIVKGTLVKVTVEELPGRTFDGQVTRDSHVLDPGTKTLLAETELANPKGELRPGMYAMVRVMLERRTNVWLVPVAALSVEKSGPSVFIVSENKAKKVPVKTGFNDGAFVEVREGLPENQPVILMGKQPLNDGQPVRVEEK